MKISQNINFVLIKIKCIEAKIFYYISFTIKGNNNLLILIWNFNKELVLT